MRWLPDSATPQKTPSGAVTPSTVGTAVPMTDDVPSGQKPRCLTADVSLDARDVLAGKYDHIPLEVLRE